VAAGNGSRGVRGYWVVQVRPMSGLPVRAVPLAAVIPSRVPGRGPGGMGRSASEVAVRRGQSRRRPRCRMTGGGADNSAASRLAAGQGKLIMLPALRGSPAAGDRGTGSGSARRAGRRRPG
jgi:hypothetical protein